MAGKGTNWPKDMASSYIVVENNRILAAMRDRLGVRWEVITKKERD